MALQDEPGMEEGPAELTTHRGVWVGLPHLGHGWGLEVCDRQEWTRKLGHTSGDLSHPGQAWTVSQNTSVRALAPLSARHKAQTRGAGHTAPNIPGVSSVK